MSTNSPLSALPNPFKILDDPSFHIPSSGDPIDHTSLQQGLNKAHELACSLLEESDDTSS
ncbi:hypothetical protein KKC44_01430 [Patescibacteria group bacterium]|nr:hypothetical protein [Patescibacteria group bacterium]MBU2259244.1 hypothetical protein [Patescibacteria group bacterium]